LSTLQRQQSVPTAAACAQLFYLGLTTLRRRLREEGTSYAKIRTDCQREYAEYLLRVTDRAVQDIALQLGFGDDRAFRRAFRGWSGVSPSEFRVNQGRSTPVAGAPASS
jgi:AraC-like DNA-binding protein